MLNRQKPMWSKKQPRLKGTRKAEKRRPYGEMKLHIIWEYGNIIPVTGGGERMDRGLVHIYCGDGKGKTTAATGLAVRAAGCGKKVLFARFLKNENSGELRVLEQIPEIDVMHPEQSHGFYWTLDEGQKAKAREVYRRFWDAIQGKIRAGGYFMLVMDEFMAAYRYGFIPSEEALELLKENPQGLEIILTGRDPAEELAALADYVSEISKVKHPFDRGIRARRGIEY